MKKVEHYICGVCGADYLDEREAQKCEGNHFAPKSIKKVNYLPFT